MELQQVLHMKEGIGKDSYASNSVFQRNMVEKAKGILEESLKELHRTISPECLVIADFGCSSGPNALMVLSDIIDATDVYYQGLNKQPPDLKVFLNDLPGNDFNTLFRMLPDFHKRIQKEKGSRFRACYVSGTPGSFYGRLFPDNFLHFAHSSISIHWLSQMPKGLVGSNGEPLNKGSIYIAKTSPSEVAKAYYDQFANDFTLFLKSRSKEIIPGGRMVLTCLGGPRADEPYFLWEWLGLTLKNMASEGLVEEEKLDKFNMPIYRPTAEDVKKLIEIEGSFTLHKLETHSAEPKDLCFRDEYDMLDPHKIAKLLIRTTRAAVEPILASEFGEGILDELFYRYEEMATKQFAVEKRQSINLFISLTRGE